MLRKRKRNKCLAIIVFLIAIFGWGGTKVNASASSNIPREKVDFVFTNNDLPIRNTFYYFLNYSTAYNKIKNGQFTDSDLKSAIYRSTAQKTGSPEGKKYIAVSYPDVSIGPGITYSDLQTKRILMKLYKGNSALLQALNETASGTIATYQAPANQSKGFQPDNASKIFTNNHGEVSSNLMTGPTIIVNSSKQFVAYRDIVPNQKKITVDVANSEKGISAKFTGVDKQYQGAQDTYIMGVGDAVNLHIHIDGEELSLGDNGVDINLPTNLVIDNPPAILGDGTLSTDKKTVVYSILLPKQYTDFDLDLSVHIGVNFQSTMNNQVSVTSTGNFDSISAQSKDLTTTGVNFVMSNSKGTTFETGAKYILCKVVNDQDMVLSKEGLWTPKTDDTADYMQLTGGNRYIIGNATPSDIPVNTGAIAKNTQKHNKSLIQIRGLSKGNDYYLQQISAPRGGALKEEKDKFEIFWSKQISPNEQRWNIISNITSAKESSVKLNSKIGDYSSKNNEYQILNVTSDSLNLNNYRFIMGMILLILFVLASIILIIFLVNNAGRKGV